VLRITGTVRERPEGMVNDKLPTGAIELAASSVEVLSEAETPPIPIEDGVDVAEEHRLRHRYVDLRRPEMARVLALRSRATSVIRRVMERHGFLDVETPLLTRATPEGARDFLVPSRLQPGETYALPQSPQLFKQLLMIAGVERYYQIARCFRDEDLRADRQPEFTQLDVELSFGDEEDVFALVEEMLAELWSELLDVEIPTPFPRMGYHEAMRRFGSDKPDLRIAMELADLDEVFADTEVGVFKGVLGDGGVVVGLGVPGGAGMTRREFDEWTEWAKRRGAKGLAWGVVEDDGSLRSPLAKFMSEDEIAACCRRPRRGRETRCSSGRVPSTSRASSWVRCGSRSPTSAAWSTRTGGSSSGSRRWRCSSPRPRVGSSRATTRSPRRRPSGRTTSRPRRSRRPRGATTSSSTAPSSGAGRSVSTTSTCS
jgi:aspartyl-tRNA synthetase